MPRGAILSHKCCWPHQRGEYDAGKEWGKGGRKHTRECLSLKDLSKSRSEVYTAILTAESTSQAFPNLTNK